jgi:O-antigen/teichoic acid export membrane protein
MLLSMGVSLYTSRVVLNTLGVVDYGINNVVGGIVALFGFFSVTLSQSTQRFLTFNLGKGDTDKLRETFSAALIIHIFLSFFILFVMETVGLWFLKNKLNIPDERKNAAFWVFQFSVFASMVSIIQSPYNASIISHEKMNIYAYISILDVLLKLVIVYLLVISSYDKLISLSGLTFVVNIIIISIYRVYCRKQYSECRFRLVTDKSLYKSMLSFSGWSILSLSAAYSATQGVNILLNIFFGPVVNAARGIAVNVSNTIQAFAGNFQTAINPNIVKLYAAGKVDEFSKLIFQNVKFTFCLMWVFILPLILRTDTVLKIWLGNVPEHAVIFCRIMLINTLTSCTFRPFSVAILATGQLRTPCLVAAIIWIVVLPVSYILLKLGFPAYISFIVSASMSLAGDIVAMGYIKSVIHISLKHLFKYVLFPVLLVIICSLPFSLLVNYYSNDDIISLFIVSFISVSLVSISVYYFAFSRDMRIKIINKLRRRPV